MENISEVIQSKKFALKIQVHPYLFDHQFLGNAVLPAVEALQVLAQTTFENYPDIANYYIKNAHFLRFLILKEEQKLLEAYNEFGIDSKGNIHSTLVTITKLRKGTITRKKEHVKIEFSEHKEYIEELSFEDVSKLCGNIFTVNSKRIYEELVPFLRSYHNIIDDMYLDRSGVIARIQAPDFNVEEGPLGSPFPFDAAFHAACVWGQRFTNIVGFPMGFRERQILQPTRSGENYMARIFPVEQNMKGNVFDIWIYDLQGVLHEVVLGVVMSDVSSGKMKPPQWIKEES